jgi:hypothetical protein
VPNAVLLQGEPTKANEPVSAHGQEKAPRGGIFGCREHPIDPAALPPFRRPRHVLHRSPNGPNGCQGNQPESCKEKP